MKKLTFLTLLVLLLALAAAVPAEAGGPPDKGEFDGQVDFVVVNCADVGAYAFQVRDQITYHTTYSLISREDDYWKSEEHESGLDVMYNASHPELSVSGTYHMTNHIERYTGPLCPTTWDCMIRNRTGVLWQVELPGAKRSIEHGVGLRRS